MPPPVKYTRELGGKIAGAVAAGSPTTVASRLAGISRATVYNWIRDYPEFATQMETAEGQRIRHRLQKIEEKAVTDWRADAWILERTSDEFREQKDIRVHVEKGVQQTLEAIRDRISASAWAEVINAFAVLQGLDEGAAERAPGESA